MSLTFLRRYTEQRTNKIIETIWPKDTYASGDRIPTDFDLDEGATSVISEVIDAEGGSDYLDSWTNEISEVDLSLSEDRTPVLDQAVAVSWTRKQVKAAELASKNGFSTSKRLLSDLPIKTATKVLTQRANLFAVYGKNNIPGLFNAPGILEEDSPFDPYGLAVTDTQLRGFITEQFGDIQFSNNVEDANDEMPDTIDLPNRLFTTMYDSVIQNTETNIVLWIKKNYPFIKNINFTALLNSENLERFGAQAPGTNKDWMMTYKKDPYYISRQSSKVIPIEVERRGLKYTVIYIMVNGQTVVHQKRWIKRTMFPKP
jgi:hypothetical protein